MSAASLARAVRERAEALLDIARDMPGAASASILRDNAELVCIVARALEGKSILRAFGAPGDWGYETQIGKALLAALRGPDSPEEMRADIAEAIKDIVLRASVVGAVVTVEQRSIQPLAMEQYETVISVRPARSDMTRLAVRVES